MAAEAEKLEVNFPHLPVRHDEFIDYVAARPDSSILELLQPFKDYDAELRKVFAQEPDHPSAQQPNVVPVFTGNEHKVTIRARDLENESDEERESYIMPLKKENRKPDGSMAIVQSLKQFQTNFNLFSENSLVDLDWSNVIVGGSAVVSSLLSVPGKHSESKRALRKYYHEQLAPASDVDLFLYGLSEDDAIEKIKQIERNVKDALLVETTTVRTKHTITIVSEYPTRHVQIVLRIYKSISEILTGYDVDCSCVAYDGKQVYASPRALASYMTQINTIDLTRRSPSYESRLAKYAHRGFEVYWPNLDRSRVDPTIYERSFGRTQGLARLLILEKLPDSADRDAYLDQRRRERGRPEINRSRMRKGKIWGNIKDEWENEVAEWVDTEDVSDYHTFTIPYGPKHNARRTERLLYTKDILLNAEWNKSKDREVHLHRHPAFVGSAEDVVADCCGFCPRPSTIEEEEVHEEESKVYISGNVSFIKDDPGRQTIGSFNPITSDDWTEMAYVSNTAMLCQAIVDSDAEFVRSWLEQEGNDPNARDWCGRTPLHLAASNSTLEIVQLLIDHKARLVARLFDGKTALHLAAMRGSVEIVSALLRKSEANEEEEEQKVDARRAARKAAKEDTSAGIHIVDAASPEPDNSADHSEEDSDVDMVSDAQDDDDDDMGSTTENSMVKIKSKPQKPDANDKALVVEEDEDQPDVYDVNVVGWDTAASPLHLAIVKGNINVVKCLVQDFGADVLLPIKLFNDYDRSARAAILTLVLSLQLPEDMAEKMTRTILELGASVAQADIDQKTVLQYCVGTTPDQLDTLNEADKPGFDRALNYLHVSGSRWNMNCSTALLIAIQKKDSLTALKLLTHGAKAHIEFSKFMKAYQTQHDTWRTTEQHEIEFKKHQEQPIIIAVQCELPLVAKALLQQQGVDPNTLTPKGYRVSLETETYYRYEEATSLLDCVQRKLKNMREWKPKFDSLNPPTPLKADEVYLSQYPDKSFVLWSARLQLDAEKSRFEKEMDNYKKWQEKGHDTTGVAEKQAAINDMIREFEELEAILKESGAKTFKELYPDIKPPEKRPTYDYNYRTTPAKPEKFKIDLSFRLPDVVDELYERYLKLFESAWSGDSKTIKELTLLPWKNAEGEDQPPLKIAVQDQKQSLSPFTIAVIRGDYALASTIMEIAQAQYCPPDEPKKHHYRINEADEHSECDSEDGSGDDEHVRLHTDIVDAEFTIETIGEVSTQVKSRVMPMSMFLWNCPDVKLLYPQDRKISQSHSGFSYFGPRKSYKLPESPSVESESVSSKSHLEGKWSPQTMIELALYKDDLVMLSYLIKLGQKFTAQETWTKGKKPRPFQLTDRTFCYALRAGNPTMVEEIIEQTGAGLPLNKLAKDSGVEMEEPKPKYYQGLTVHGRKRKEWADAGRNTSEYTPYEKSCSPLLESAYFNSLKLVEWFLSDAPMRCYKVFSDNCKEDKRLIHLSKAKGGFKESVSKFLGERSQLIIHACITGRKNNVKNYEATLRYLVSTMPENIDTKSAEGLAPLHIAFEHFDDVAVKILIGAGADQTCRDKAGNNLVHKLLKHPRHSKKGLAKLDEMFGLIDKRLLTRMMTERSAEHPGSLTPLADWIRRTHSCGWATLILDSILKQGNEEELGMIKGEGDTPLHVCVRNDHLSLAKLILDRNPSLCNRENATGRTPYEMAEDKVIAASCSDPPYIPSGSGHFDDIVNSSHSKWVKKDEGEESETEKSVWSLLVSTKKMLEAKGDVKRRLVTLNEANEVARRLAADKSGSNNGHGVQKWDEIAGWNGSAELVIEED
ncbi:Hypothetical protein R9X50_00586300 [Acrodontium crateriforme]|uniref:Ankyrin repeat protein n=1 Tax=Acrodontium crateriforme TaxID=150365 RepID=A0AAQ3R6C2_9PEZI|nr:Hypothetical protein R9X50_00586300 [Acrodontium crateriforme]